MNDIISPPKSRVITLRLPIQYRILLDILSKREGKTRSRYARDILVSSLLEIRRRCANYSWMKHEFENGYSEPE